MEKYPKAVHVLVTRESYAELHEHNLDVFQCSGIPELSQLIEALSSHNLARSKTLISRIP